MLMKMKRRLKQKRKKPSFLRQEWFRHGNVRKKWLKWRRPRGRHSKLRRHVKGKGFRPHPGYGAPAVLKGLHPSGLKEVLVCNTTDLKKMDPKTEAARIAKKVGAKKRLAIQAEAGKMKIKVLNPKKLKLKVKKKTAQTTSAELSQPTKEKKETPKEGGKE